MLQTAQLLRPHVYNDNLQHFNISPPPNTLNWTRVENDHDEADSDIEESLKSQGMHSSDEAESTTDGIVRGAGSSRGTTK
ncbi:5915_t:CDS:1, partial [Funneliformis caledonium]